ncbi:DUF6705 family protein [Flavobacterium sp. SUN052]|uniref:DUF6705 family protein n=1 Tax=Flavobacterium sp. SUN052 TaxID=3002441 RepID=UPI00237E79D3|nr:DUF6705 family protein [Flavobacterium sp. SUN052]MEC4004948.1 DUF6705 family protein [Flavobacterium sp. SUN052]
MKKTLITLTIFIAFSCKSQIIPQNNAYVEIPNNAYIKDTENFLNNFVGTWHYQKGNEQFSITLLKVLHKDYGSYYNDIIIGEYKYIDSNGTTIVNTLSDINIPSIHHNISGAKSLIRLEYPKCPECNVGEYRIKSFFYDPERKYQNLAIVFRSISATQIKIKLYTEGVSTTTGPNAIDEMRVPAGEYILNKI